MPVAVVIVVVDVTDAGAAEGLTGGGEVIKAQSTSRLTTRVGGGGGTRPRYQVVCLWRCLLASRHCSF